MSVRLLTVRLLNHGRFLLNYWKRDIHNNILEQKRIQRHQERCQPRFAAFRGDGQKNAAKQALNASSSGVGQLTPNLSRSPPVLSRFGQHARKLFIDNILSRVTTTYSADLRNQATKKLFYGDSAPFFALVGVSLASGAGVLTKEDELEGVCWEIREAATRLQNSWDTNVIRQESLNGILSIDKLSVGPVIAKGCSAVVYAANLKSNLEKTFCENGKTENVPDVTLDNVSQTAGTATNTIPDYITPLHNMSRFVHNFGASVDNLQLFSQTSRTNSINSFDESFTSSHLQASIESEQSEEKCNRNDSIEHLSKGKVETVHPPKVSSLKQEKIKHKDEVGTTQNFPFALKMMFNYDIQSNATAILRAMYKETIPARQRFLNSETRRMWEEHIEQRTLPLPPHPNIVCMYGYFCDEVGSFPEGHNLYPVAQPQRINPDGYGRNMSLYLLMKRYDSSLRTFLNKYNDKLTMRNKLLLLAQLLEAVAHINRHSIAHRDIKTDNILLEYMDTEANSDTITPQLVLTDFGCCLADRYHGLQIPYNHHDIDKGGNAALMAPEILNKQPGPFTVLNYEKADLWACGSIAYEIFGLPNPFYQNNHKGQNNKTKSLHSVSYKVEDLPPLGSNNGNANSECPKLIQQLVYNILSPNPSKRVSPDVAANVMQLYLWAPSQWLKPGQMPNSPEILQWLLSLTTKVMCEARSTALISSKTNSPSSGLLPAVNVLSDSAFTSSLANSLISYQQNGRRTYVEYILICSFLARVRLRRIRGALNWIQSVV